MSSGSAGAGSGADVETGIGPHGRTRSAAADPDGDRDARRDTDWAAHRLATLGSLPPEWHTDPAPAVADLARELDRTVVVLDDDPTGTQTVHDVTVLTTWSVEDLRSTLATKPACLYVLTNSRSLSPPDARARSQEVGRNLREAALACGRRLVMVSRSDSTLRGHFPDEVDALVDGLGEAPDAWVLVPFFIDAGRITVDDVHYIDDGTELRPVNETEFAGDAAFGYRHANLRLWAEEKSGGRFEAGTTASVSLRELRRLGPAHVAERIGSLSKGGLCVVNSVTARDLDVFLLGALTAERRGSRLLYRAAASIVPGLAGMTRRPLLDPNGILEAGTTGGLIVVGSYVPTTSAQVQALLDAELVDPIELVVARVLSEDTRVAEIQRVATHLDRSLEGGSDAMVYTSRTPVAGLGRDESLAVGQRVSTALTEVVRSLTVRPRYCLAKGGITSSDVATGALAARRATVRGQIEPGVPVWTLGGEARYPGMAYVVFPGNVGDAAALARVVSRLRRPEKGTFEEAAS